MRHFSRIMLVIAILLAQLSALTHGEDTRRLTVMVYMCGSNLESLSGSATSDIEEILRSGFDADQVNLVVKAGGSRRWDRDIRSGEAGTIEFFKKKGKLKKRVVRPEPDVNMGDPEILTRFIRDSIRLYPAREYALILWDHGAGPLEGVCLDELNEPDRISLNGLTQALEAAGLPKKLSWIGFDACLMSTVEVANAVAPYAEYMIASEETEPASGWNYAFLAGIERDADGAATGRRVVDCYFTGENEGMSDLTMSCLDLSKIAPVIQAMDAFFSPIGRNMKAEIFTKLSGLRQASSGFGSVVRGLTTDGYDLVDLGDLVEHYGTLGNAEPLRQAVKDAVVYSRANDLSVSGLSVYHTLHNKTGYSDAWKDRYAQLDFCPGYQKYLERFGTLLTGMKLADWSGLRLSDDGFGVLLDNLYSLQLNAEQRQSFTAAQLVIMGAHEDDFGAQLAGIDQNAPHTTTLYPVSVSGAEMDETGLLTASYTGRSLYLVDEHGKAVAGPIGYSLSDDGQELYIRASYFDNSGRENAAPNVHVLYTCRTCEGSDYLSVVRTEVYDEATDTYTRRISFSETNYTDMWIDQLARILPETSGTLPGISEWQEAASHHIRVLLPLKWRLCMFDEQISGTPLYAILQITDAQQNRYCTPPVQIENPNLFNIELLPRTFYGPDYELTLYAVRDTSQLNPGLTIGARIMNTSLQDTINLGITNIMLNNSRTVGRRMGQDTLFVPFVRLRQFLSNAFTIFFGSVAPGESDYRVFRIDQASLAGLDELSNLSFTICKYKHIRGYGLLFPDNYQCSMEGYDVTALSEHLDSLLCEVPRRQAIWQLISLKKGVDGSLTGALRVINHSDDPIEESFRAIVNESVQMMDTIAVDVPPHMDSCIPIKLENSFVNDPDVYNPFGPVGYVNDGSLYWNHCLEQSGIRQIESLRLCSSSGDAVDDVCFDLPSPIPFASEQIVQGIQYFFPECEERSLLDGDLSVKVDHVSFSRDLGVDIRMKLKNNTDRDMQIKVRHCAVCFDGYARHGDEYESALNLSANASALCRYSQTLSRWQFAAPPNQLTDLGLIFEYDGMRTDWVRLHLNTPISVSELNSTPVSMDDFTVTHPTEIRPIADVYQSNPVVQGDSAFMVTVGIVDETGPMSLLRWKNLSEPVLSLSVGTEGKNLSDETLDCRFENFVLNDIRTLDNIPLSVTLKPGKTFGNVMEFEFRAEDIVDLRELNSVSCVLTLTRHRNGETVLQAPICLEFPAYTLWGVENQEERLTPNFEGIG